MNDFPAVTSKCSVFQYADDTVLLSSHLSFTTAACLLQNNVCRAMKWFSENGLIVNMKKTELLCFRNPLKRVNLNVPIFLHEQNCFQCQCVPLDYVNSIKYLGVYFDSDLSWNSHLAFVCGRLRGAACALFNMKSLVPLPVKKMVMHALAYSVLRYGITVYAHCSSNWKDRIDSLLKNMLKSIVYSSSVSTSVNLFTAVQLPSFHALFFETVILKHFWNCDLKLQPNVSRVLRNELRYSVPRCSTRYGKATRNVYVPVCFNQLSEDFFAVTSKRQLQKLLHFLR